MLDFSLSCTHASTKPYDFVLSGFTFLLKIVNMKFNQKLFDFATYPIWRLKEKIAVTATGHMMLQKLNRKWLVRTSPMYELTPPSPIIGNFFAKLESWMSATWCSGSTRVEGGCGKRHFPGKQNTTHVPRIKHYSVNYSSVNTVMTIPPLRLRENLALFSHMCLYNSSTTKRYRPQVTDPPWRVRFAAEADCI